MLLCDHASANTDHEIGVLDFEVLVLPNDGKCLLLRMLANGTGVDQDQIGLIRQIRPFISHGKRKACKLFAIRLILLTSKGQDKDAPTSSALRTEAFVFRANTSKIGFRSFRFRKESNTSLHDSRPPLSFFCIFSLLYIIL